MSIWLEETKLVYLKEPETLEVPDVPRAFSLYTRVN
jgi:hypothetical protein